MPFELSMEVSHDMNWMAKGRELQRQSKEGGVLGKVCLGSGQHLGEEGRTTEGKGIPGSGLREEAVLASSFVILPQARIILEEGA